MCGMATTVKEARRVPAKRVEVAVERGWRCGGMVGELGNAAVEGGEIWRSWQRLWSRWGSAIVDAFVGECGWMRGGGNSCCCDRSWRSEA